MGKYEFMEQQMALKLIKAAEISRGDFANPENKKGFIDFNHDDLHKIIAFADECLNKKHSEKWAMLTSLIMNADCFRNIENFLDELEHWKEYYEKIG